MSSPTAKRLLSKNFKHAEDLPPYSPMAITKARPNSRDELAEMKTPKKTSHGLRLWGSLRSWFNSIVVLFMALLVLIAISLTVKTGGLREDNMAVNEAASDTCDFFSGRWVYDEKAYPLYQEKACKFMSDQSACEKFGRKDLRYQHWRWQPHGCDLPRFNATKLLQKLRGKRLAFVGDSLNRNQWISMVCLLDTATPTAQKSQESNGSLISFRIKDYDASIDFYWSPLLVESNSDDPVHHRISDRIVRAQSIEKHARHWTNVDVLVFNSYLWWRRDTMKVLWGSFEDKDAIYKEIPTLRSYEMALRTWSDWLEFHVDPLKTKLFFVSMSPTHFWPRVLAKQPPSGHDCVHLLYSDPVQTRLMTEMWLFGAQPVNRGDEWGIDAEQNCYNETMPITKDGYWGRGSDARVMNIVQEATEGLRARGVSVQMLNVTQLSEYRKDAHPSTYRKQWEPLTKEQIANPSSYADCIHWCLPGVPDVWNEILYAYLFSG